MPLKGTLPLSESDMMAVRNAWQDETSGLEEKAWHEVVEICRKARQSYIELHAGSGEKKSEEILRTIRERRVICPICYNPEKFVQFVATHEERSPTGELKLTAHTAFCRECTLEYIQRSHECAFCRAPIKDLIDLERAAAESLDPLSDVKVFVVE